ncbi:hypothetical protein UFOVP1264_76 [uncultured Caudovirales phage]|uniref:Uncharacterized protein n=1 Tax=uncultured Caudovirales phage TaxID=2100421 RepID=A0A6J5RLV4_9CAUD|nr:hypothetical protein UFOVP1264_76 [uncultured Caudovirales phage]
MATTTMAPVNISDDVKTVVVKVRTAATLKLEFLRALVKKIASASKQGAYSVIGFAKRFWETVPASVSGAVAAGLASTREGYQAATSFIRNSLRWVTGLAWGAARMASMAVDKALGFTAKVVGTIYAPAGEFLANANDRFTSMRETAMNYVYTNLYGVGTVLKAAYNTTTTVALTTGFATAVSAAFVAKAALPEIASNALALVATVPVVSYMGRWIEFALTGGVATFLSLALVATIGAVASFFFNKEEIQESIVEEIIGLEHNADKIMRVVEKLNKVVDNDSVELVETVEPTIMYKSVIEPQQVTTEILEMASGEVAVLVSGDLTEDEAQAVADEHVEREIADLERRVNKQAYPAKKNHNKGKR